MFNIIVIIIIFFIILTIAIIGYAYWEKYKQDKNWGYIEKEWHDREEL